MLSVHATMADDEKILIACVVNSCDFTTYKEYIHEEHVLMCHPELCVKCLICTQVFFNQRQLDAHIRSYHQDSHISADPPDIDIEGMNIKI